jgi:hypothetical protein
MSIKDVKSKDATACNHDVVKGFYSAPAEQIYTLEASSTEHWKELTSIQTEKLFSYKQVSVVQLLDKNNIPYFYRHKNPSGINLHKNSSSYRAQRSP